MSVVTHCPTRDGQIGGDFGDGGDDSQDESCNEGIAKEDEQWSTSCKSVTTSNEETRACLVLAVSSPMIEIVYTNSSTKCYHLSMAGFEPSLGRLCYLDVDITFQRRGMCVTILLVLVGVDSFVITHENLFVVLHLQSIYEAELQRCPRMQLHIWI